MTEIIASSFLIGAAASYPLLRWARTKNVDLMKIDYVCTTKLLPLLPFGLAGIMGAIYSPAYAIAMMTVAAVVALLTATAVERFQNNERGSFSRLMTDAKEEEVNVDRVKRWISGMHAFVLVLLLSIVGAEVALWDSPGNGIALPFPRLYAFLGGTRATNALLDTVGRKDKALAADAVMMLIDMGKEDEIVRLGGNAVPILAALLHYTDDSPNYVCTPISPEINDGSIRGKAAGMLARMGRPAIAALFSALFDKDSAVSALAAAALAETGDSTLLFVLRDTHTKIHQPDVLYEGNCGICSVIRQMESK